MTHTPLPAAAYWGTAFKIEDADIEYLNNLLLEDETPLTSAEMTFAIVRRRCEREAEAAKHRQQGAAFYLPKETYTVGQTVAFPQLQFAIGQVTNVRVGRNPTQGEFDVIAIDFGNGKVPREFAARFDDHKLNHDANHDGSGEAKSPEEVFKEFGPSLMAKLETRLKATADIVRLAGRWFPRELLATINEGHLNLAEAVLDMAGGGPLPTEALLKEVGLATNINPRLQAFSLDYALQEDERFDEVGPTGEVLWYLRRLEPPEVTFPPRRLDSAAPEMRLAELPDVLVKLEQELDDELSPAAEADPAAPVDEVTLHVTFPHRRSGTLPLASRLAPLFPTALESPRVRFLWMDGDTGEQFPGWVVRANHYVFGLEEWYKKHDFPAGGLLTVRRGETPDVVVLKAGTRRPNREWVRTAVAGTDNRLNFSLLKKPVAVSYDELTIIAADNLTAIDEVWNKSQHLPFERLVADVFRELAKLNPQSTVHAKTLYAAVNVARRSPPGPIFTELVTRPYFVHVGDAYWRFDLSQWTE